MIDEGDGGDPLDLAGPDQPRDGVAGQVGARRPMSYSASALGAESGRPVPAPPPPPASRRRFAIAALAIVAILVAGSALVVWAAVPNGFGSTGIRPNAPPSESPNAGSRAASPRPTQTIDPGAAVLARFWALVSDPKASYHLTATGKSVLDKKTFETFKEYDESGPWRYKGGALRSHDEGRTWGEMVISAASDWEGDPHDTMWWDPRIARWDGGTSRCRECSAAATRNPKSTSASR